MPGALPTPGPRGTARGRPLTHGPAPATSGARSPRRQRLDELAGTATHLTRVPAGRAPRPLGAPALRATAGCPTRSGRTSAGTPNIKVLLARRHHKAHREPDFQVFVCFPARRLLLRTTFARPRRAARPRRRRDRAGGEAPDWERGRGPAVRRVHPRPPRRLLRRARPAGGRRADGVAPRADLGGLARRRRPVRGQRPGAARGALLRPDGARDGQPGGDAARGRAGSTSTGCAAARRTRCPCSTPRSRCAATSRRTGSTPCGWCAGGVRPACSAAGDRRLGRDRAPPDAGRGAADLRRRAAQPAPGARSGLAPPDLRQCRAGLRQLPMSRGRLSTVLESSTEHQEMSQMYNALNEQYMFQEHARPDDGHARRTRCPGHPARRPPLVAQGHSPCAMMTDVRMERGRTESIVGREAELDALLRDCRRRHPDGAALRRRRGRQDPAGDRGPGRTRRAGLAAPGRALPRLRRELDALPPVRGDAGTRSPPRSPRTAGQPRSALARLGHPAARRRTLRGPRPGRGLRGRPAPWSRRWPPAVRSCWWSRTPTGPTPAPAT